MDGFKQLARGSSVRKWQSQDGGGIRGEEGFFFFFLIGTLCTYPKQRRIMGVGETLSSEGNGLASPLASLSGKHALWLPSLLNQAGSAARRRPRRGLPVPAGHRLHSQEPAVHQRLGLAATGRCAPLSPGPPPTHRPPAASVHPVSLPPPFSRLILTVFPTCWLSPPQCGGTCREHHSVALLRSHLWTNSPLVSRVGVGEVRSLEMCGCPSPSMLWGGGSGPRLPSMPFTTKGYLLPSFLIFRSVVSFVGGCCCSLLIELGSNPCPRFFTSVALCFCGIPSLLTGYCSRASALRKLREA